MVLEKLSSSLKETLRKIARGMFVDEKLIDELVKDIQKALLQADVNVELVFNLTKEIKRRAIEEKDVKGINVRERIVKIVYEELVKFLGEEKAEIKITKKPYKIMMVGLFGSGKCVHKDSRILLSDGGVITAEQFYNKYKEKEESIEDGAIIDIEQENILVPSFNPSTLKIEDKKVTHIWKLNSKDLLQVSLDNGNDFNVKVTPEHPFFVLRNGRVEKVRAVELTEDDVVAVPSNCQINGKKQHLFKELKELDLMVKGYKLNTSNIDIMNELMPKLKFNRNYSKLTRSLKRSITPIHFVESYEDNLIIKTKGGKDFISVPGYLTEELAEFLGYVIGDGHLERNYVQISNEDTELIERIKHLSYKLFSINVSAKKARRTRRMYDLRLTSRTLVDILNKIFKIPVGKKGRNLMVPNQILKSETAVIRSFLRAYFDCDASAAENSRGIELLSESESLVIQVAYLLNRFGIISSLSKKYVNNLAYWRLVIRARYAELYASKIGFLINHKSKRVEDYHLIGKLQGCGKQDMLPLGKSLYTLRQSLGFSIGEIQNHVSSYGLYEAHGEISRESLAGVVALYHLKKKGNISIVLDYLNGEANVGKLSNGFVNGFISHLKAEGLVREDYGGLLLTQKAIEFKTKMGTEQELLDSFRALINSEVCWLRVNRVDNMGYTDYVYDLTVEDNHSFIADNIIVHNTTSTGKLAKYYSKRGYKVALLGLDVHRPAAIDQIEQIAKQVNVRCFTDRKQKNPVKIYDEYGDELKKFDVVIIDTAGRDALSKDLIEEIEALNKRVRPEENLLVISADIGQAARSQAEQFHKSCRITGVIATKLDGTAKAGGALSACSVTNAKIKFIGIGEKLDDLEEFNPKGFVSRMLGMGDLEALLEKAKEAITEEQAEDLGRKFLKGEFNFIDLYEQMQALNKMGSIGKLMEMVPGLGQLKMPKELLEVQEGKLKKWRYILDSMNKAELENPDLLADANRINRIAKGAGVATSDVRELLKQYKQSKKLMKMMGGTDDPKKLMKKFGGKLKGMGA